MKYKLVVSENGEEKVVDEKDKIIYLLTYRDILTKQGKTTYIVRSDDNKKVWNNGKEIK